MLTELPLRLRLLALSESWKNMDFSQTKDVPLEAFMPLIRERLACGKSVWLYPRGTSMLPMLRQGIDKVLLSPLPKKLKKYDLPFYQRDNGQYVLHRIVEVGETCTCIGDNQFLLENNVRPDQMIAVVTAFSRGKKEISTSNLFYQLYCRFWYYSRPFRHLWYRGISRLRRHLK